MKGWSYNKTSQVIREKFTDMSRARAQLIATNEGRHRRMKLGTGYLLMVYLIWASEWKRCGTILAMKKYQMDVFKIRMMGGYRWIVNTRQGIRTRRASLRAGAGNHIKRLRNTKPMYR